MVHGLQEAAERGRKLFQKIANTLKGKLEVAKSILADEQERMVMIQLDKYCHFPHLSVEPNLKSTIICIHDEGGRAEF
ncbi:putative E3 ubiquitin-protein ligase TRIML2 [Manis javanica]|nr:putative E3 ubiquitin-protein ligase TRIML2 [Manis javanica]